MCRSIGGQPEVIGRPIIGLIANGNLCIDGLPRRARTRAIHVAAKDMASEIGRIRFAPDLRRSAEAGSKAAGIPALNPIWRPKIVAPRPLPGINGGTKPETTSNGSTAPP